MKTDLDLKKERETLEKQAAEKLKREAATKTKNAATPKEETAAAPMGDEVENIDPANAENEAESESEVDTANTQQESPQDIQNAPVIDYMKNPDILAYIDLKVTEGIKQALKGNVPKADLTDATEEERKLFGRMNYKERLNLKLSNPHKYKQLAERK